MARKREVGWVEWMGRFAGPTADEERELERRQARPHDRTKTASSSFGSMKDRPEGAPDMLKIMHEEAKGE